MCLVRGRGGAVSETVVHSGGNQRRERCGRRRSFGGGGVVRLAKIVEVDMYGFKILRCAVKIKWDLVRALLVVRAWRCALRRCH